MTPAIREFLMRPEPLIVTKSNLVSRVHRRAYADYVGVKRYGPKGALAGEIRFVGLFTSTAYTRSVRGIPLLRRKVDRIIALAGLDAGQPFRQGAVERARDLSARRAVPDRRGDAARLRAADPGARRAAAGPGARPPRPLRPLRLGDRLRAARPLRQQRARSRSATTSPRPSTATSRPTTRPSPKARWCASTSSSAAPAARRPTPTRRRSRRRSPRSSRDWEDDLAAAVRREYDAEAAEDMAAAWRGAFPPATATEFAPAAAVSDIRIVEGLDDGRPIAGFFHRGRRRSADVVKLKIFHLGGPIALSVRVPMLEDMGFGSSTSRPTSSRRPTRTPSSSTTCSSSGPTASRSISPPRRRSLTTASSPSGTARPRATATTRSSSRPAWRGATSRCCAPSRATCGRAARR